ncbi:MAG: hypothetical protein HKN56_05445 [Gammaproteobacteria bacterium]|nr:hypothetical protein [Gammaproteobacteria bacterium]
MTFAFWCIPLAMFLPLVWVGIAKSMAKGYDNRQPREWLATLEGRAKRANWAQQNSYEAFPPFAAAVIVAHLTGSAQLTIDIIAGLFILLRIAHGITYIADKDMLRSLLWLGGYGCTLALFIV